jgi:N-methylhydantoinase A/oxoprolinase/acetone carboxylase beta subunit
VNYTQAFFELNGELRKVKTPIWKIEDLSPTSRVHGPAIILIGTGTIVVEPDFSAFIDSKLNIFLKFISPLKSNSDPS